MWARKGGGQREGNTIRGTFIRVPLHNECPQMGRLLTDAVVSFDAAAGSVRIATDDASYSPDTCRWQIGEKTVTLVWKRGGT